MRHCVLLAALALGACAQIERQPESEPAAHAPARPVAMAVPGGIIADEVRLFQVSYPLLRAARNLCREASLYGMGLYALNRHTMGAYRQVAWRYGIGNAMRVLAAIPDGPAYRSGLTAGDVILAVNDEPAPTTAASTRAFGLRMARIAQLGKPVAVTVQRGAQRVSATVQPEQVCGYQVRVSEARQVNARADGRRTVYVTRGMLEFAQDDAELALVVAHEIAHNALGHLQARSQLMRSLVAAGGVPKGAAANGMTPAFSQALEMEADRTGLYLVARAGMDISGAPAFLERLAARGGGEAHAQTHPTSAARVSAVKKVVREIERKRAAGQALAP